MCVVEVARLGWRGLCRRLPGPAGLLTARTTRRARDSYLQDCSK